MKNRKIKFGQKIKGKKPRVTLAFFFKFLADFFVDFLSFEDWN